MKKQLLYLLFLLTATALFSQSENGVRVITGKCAISQTGSGSGYWQIGVTNFNDPGGQIDASDIEVGWYIQFSDGGNPYQLEITAIVGSPSGSSGTFRVSNVGVVGISSVPTTSNAFITERTFNFGLTPFPANLSGNDAQLGQEYTMYKIDSILAVAAGHNWFTTTDTLVFSPSGKTPVNGDFAFWKNRGQLMEKKAGYWQPATSKNGENVHSNHKVAVNYAGANTNYNLSLGNYFYTSCVGDITIKASNETLQATNNSVVFEVFNNTEDYIDASFESGTFIRFGVKSSDGTVIDMPAQRISAFGTRLFKFTVVNLGEVAYLVSDQVDGGSYSGYYTPTLTKAVSSDTIVTVYRHHYEVNGNEVTVYGRALVNNLTSTLSSSFLVSMPPFITSNFSSYYDDATGNCYSYRRGTLSPQYLGDIYADTTQHRVSVYYVCDGSSLTRQVVNYTYTFTVQ